MIKRFLLYIFLFCVPCSLFASLSSTAFVISDSDLQQVIVALDEASFKKDIHKVVEIYNSVGHQAFICIATSLCWACGNSLLHKAAYDDAGEIVFFLLWLGIDPNLLNIWNETALVHSIHWGNAQMVSLFLQNKVDITIKNFQNKTALHIAREWDHQSIVLLLCNNGAPSIQ